MVNRAEEAYWRTRVRLAWPSALLRCAQDNWILADCIARRSFQDDPEPEVRDCRVCLFASFMSRRNEKVSFLLSLFIYDFVASKNAFLAIQRDRIITSLNYALSSDVESKSCTNNSIALLFLWYRDSFCPIRDVIVTR